MTIITRSLLLPRLNSANKRSFWSAIRNTIRPPRPPIAKKWPATTAFFGRSRIDNYAWLQNADDKKVIEHISAENLYAERMLANKKQLKSKVFIEMKSILSLDQSQPVLPEIVDGYEYFSKPSTRGSIYTRRRLGSVVDELVFDESVLEPGHSLKTLSISPNHNIVGFIVEEEGSEVGDLYFQTVGGKAVTKPELRNIFHFEWSNDSKAVYYTVPNNELRPYKVYYHQLHTGQPEDILVFHEESQEYFLDVGKTKDKNYITISSNTFESSEVHVLDANETLRDPSSVNPKLIQKRQAGLEYYIDHHENDFYILTNADNAINFKLVRAPADNPQKSNWQDIVVLPPDCKIEDVDLFKNHIVFYLKQKGISGVKVYNIQSKKLEEIDLPEKICVVNPGLNKEFDTDTFRFRLRSPFLHESIFDYNMAENRVIPRAINRVSTSAFNQSQFDVVRIHVPARDGARIPVTLLHRKGLPLDGCNPINIRAYGAYGVSLDPELRVESFPLLERDWIIALAHVRGGGELGRQWYLNGKQLQKKNTFNDFIDVTSYLVENKLTHPRLVTASGMSAGGLCVATASLMRPDLFRAISLRVPFVDVLTALLDEELPLTRVEWSEWGNPKDPKVYDYIASYSPYEIIPSCPSFSPSASSPPNSIPPLTITPPSFPSMYITATLNDQRVPYWQPLKFVARLREHILKTYSNSKTGNKRNGKEPVILLQTDESGGHFGSKQDDDRLEKRASEVVWLLDTIGMDHIKMRMEGGVKQSNINKL